MAARLDRVVPVALLLVLVGVVAWSLPPVQRWWPGACTVGLAGAAVSIHVEGPGADKECDAIAGTTTDGGTWYRYDSGTQPGGAVICQPKSGLVTFTIRDTGVLTMYGNAACKWLMSRPLTPG